MFQKAVETIKEFPCRDNGAIAILAALVFPVMLGFAALSLEYGTTLTKKAHNQRVSDLAAFAAAFEYLSSDADDKVAAARLAGKQLASLNGITTGVTIIFDDEDAPTWVQVDILETKEIYLSRLLRPDDSTTVVTRARVELAKGGVIPCILGLGSGAGDGITVNGNSGQFNLEGCGVGTNSELAVNGGVLDTECAAEQFKKDNVCEKGEEENSTSNFFQDPIASITQWPTNDGDDIACDFKGKLLDDLSEPETPCKKNKCKIENYLLKSGVLCVTEFQKDFTTLESAGATTLIFKSGVDITLSGKQSLSIDPPLSGNFTGVALYAPASELTMNGNPSFSVNNIGCFGLVAKSMTFNGNVTVNANCDTDDNLLKGSSSIGGKPRLIQ